ncbi:hypothetical protein AAFF27_07980 [Xylophilus sp. GW821-FHT01B05]
MRMALVAGIAGLLSCAHAHAMEPSISEVAKSIVDSAPPKSRYFHVSVGLKVKNSIADLMEANRAGRTLDFSAGENAVLDSIKGEYLEAAVWRSRLGGMDIYVTQAGLDGLQRSPGVRSIMPAHDKGRIYDPYGDLRRIEQEILHEGVARVNLIPASPAWRWELGRDGNSIFSVPAGAIQDAIDVKRRFVDSLSPAALRGHDLAGNPSIGVGGEHVSLDASITIEGLYELKNREDIVSIRPIDKANNRVVFSNPVLVVDDEALATARREGPIAVSISLKRQPGYTPRHGILSAAARQSQEDSLRRNFEDIASAFGEDARKSVAYYSVGAVVTAQLSYSDLLRLYEHPDPRIEQINMNRAMATVGGMAAPEEPAPTGGVP